MPHIEIMTFYHNHLKVRRNISSSLCYFSTRSLPPSFAIYVSDALFFDPLEKPLENGRFGVFPIHIKNIASRTFIINGTLYCSYQCTADYENAGYYFLWQFT